MPSFEPVAASSRPSAVRARRLFRWASGLALLAGAGAAVAGGIGVGLLNLAAGRAHQVATGVAYGPLERQRFDLYRPDAAASSVDPGAGVPLVVFVYGGTWNSGERADYRFVGEALAARGFAAMVVDYRLSPAVRYPAFVQDCARAVGHALEHAREFGADPRRVFLFGHSAGAYNVAMLALDPRWLGEVGHAPRELAGWVGLAGPYDFLPIVDADVKRAFDWPATKADTQPLVHASAGEVAPPLPVFLGVAAQDTLVDPIRNTGGLARALRAHEARVEAPVYEGVGHATLLGALAWPLRGRASVLDDVVAFVRGTAPARQP